MQRPCRLITIRRVKLVNRMGFTVTAVVEEGIRSYHYLEGPAPMQSLLIPLMGSDKFNAGG